VTKTSKDSLLIDETNLSTAWAKAFLTIIDGVGKRIAPMSLTIRSGNGLSLEDDSIRTALDKALEDAGEQRVHTVANTLFPASVWRFSKGDRARLYETYLKNVPRYVALAKSKNNRGLYFERLIAYGAGPFAGNQLEYMIQAYLERKGVRASMFQAAIFDPARDHIKSAQMGFPCLHSLSLVPSDGGLTLNAFYPTQQIFEKAYGNYLGLYRLGGFMADQMGLEMRQLSCFVGVEKLDAPSKSAAQLAPLIEACRLHLKVAPQAPDATAT
jgi:hypothetical protein